ncbi:condensation domain-containing protein [Amycolatopsis sp. A1MSW2902]|uniref:condensation domain-containing protein n=1 Tax=Amycolatopsis sp. A1MSW2902 TaxID=687413 RepID=UPI00307D55B6
MRHTIEDIYRLTPIQHGLLYEQLADPGSGVYLEQLTLDFDGPLDPDVVAISWQAVVDRHPILRTSFRWHSSGRVLQVVHDSARLEVPVHDWRTVSPAEQRSRAAEWLARDRAEGFELTQAPLMRADLVCLAPERWRLLWRFSHLLLDGWSFGVAVGEFVEHYRATVTGRAPELAPTAPYRDYVGWWQARDTAEAERFWRAELAGYVPAAPLSVEPDRLEPGEFPHDWVEVELGDLAPRLRELATRNRLTPNSVVHGAWTLLLARYHGTGDVLCGSTVAHRPADLPGAERMLGPMVWSPCRSGRGSNPRGSPSAGCGSCRRARCGHGSGRTSRCPTSPGSSTRRWPGPCWEARCRSRTFRCRTWTWDRRESASAGWPTTDARTSRSHW